MSVERRYPRTILQERAKPLEARGVTMHCDGCQQDLHIAFPYGCEIETRQRLIREVVEEHRRLTCTVGSAEVGRSYKIEYPRA